jgi:hypothetical protein
MHQRRWKNWLPYLTGLVAVLTLFVSVVAYTWSATADLRRWHFGRDDVQAISYFSNGDLIFYNSGDRDLLIHSVLFSTTDPPWDMVVPVGKTIKRGEVLVHSARDTDVYFADYKVVDGDTFSAIQENAVYQWDLYSIFFTKDHPALKAHARCARLHLFDEATATTVCYSLKDNKRIERIERCTAASGECNLPDPWQAASHFCAGVA